MTSNLLLGVESPPTNKRGSIYCNSEDLRESALGEWERYAINAVVDLLDIVLPTIGRGIGS